MYSSLSFPMTRAMWEQLGIRPRSRFRCELHRDDGVVEVDVRFDHPPFVGVEPDTLVVWCPGVGQVTYDVTM